MIKEPSVLLSFIIPVYNGEKTIEKTLDSIFKQTANIPFEVIAIDDGSKDLSLDILKSYPSNLCIKSIQNSGVSVARNTGLALAKGEYVFFLDCDDQLDPDFFENITPILKKNPEMVCGNYCVTDGKTIQPRLSLKQEVIQLKQHAGLDDFLFGDLETQINGTTSNKIYSMDIIRKNQLSFIVGKTMSEDWMFNASYLENVKTIHTTSANMFYYYKNPESVTQTYNKNYTKDIMGFIEDIQSMAKKYAYPLQAKDLTLFYLKRWFGVLSNECRNPNRKEGYQKFKNYITHPYFQSHLKEVKPNNNKERVYKYLTIFHLYGWVYRIVYMLTKR